MGRSLLESVSDAPTFAFIRRHPAAIRATRRVVLLCMFAAVARTPPALATAPASFDAPRPQDSFMYFGESVGSRASWPSSTAWGLEFRQVDAPHFAWSVAYLNDGHFPGHHRDGISAEAWVPFAIADRLTLSLGGGPFYYFDTEHAQKLDGYADVHGWAWLLSADMRIALWSHLQQPGWFLDLRYDWSAPAHDIETHSIAVGVGYRMYSDFASGTATQGTVEGFSTEEIAGYVGKTVVNSFSSQWSFAEALEYRHQLLFPFLRGSVALVNEGDAQLVRRKGVIYELWAEPSFWDGNASVGVGWGGYTAVDKSRPTPGRHVSYVTSITLSARLLNLVPIWKSTAVGERTDVRVTWHRIVTDYDRDTDILLFGLGYRFDL
jgi:hypothetical protein